MDADCDTDRRAQADTEQPVTTITYDLPPGTFSALRLSPKELAKEMKVAACIQWYAQGLISQGKAAEIAGLGRAEFLEELFHRKVGPGRGESEVLALALKPGVWRAVVDDLEARRCAQALGARVIGTLGVVLRAKRKGLIPAARPVVDRLRRVGLYVSDELVERALTHLGETLEDS